MIESFANKRIKNIVSLRQRGKERKKQQRFLVEGVKMFLEAPTSWIKEIYIRESFVKSLKEPGERNEKISEKLSKLEGVSSIIIEQVSNVVFDKISDTMTPQGILVVLSMPQYKVEHCINDNKGMYLVLEDIQDPGNLGTMLRASEGAGVTAVLMSKNTVDIFNPKTIRATMGSIYRVPFLYMEDFNDVIGKMKDKNIQILAADLEGAKSYDEVDNKKGCAFMIGNEGNGLSNDAKKLADQNVIIPMLGRVESLNAAVAATIFMYEAARQRRQ